MSTHATTQSLRLPSLHNGVIIGMHLRLTTFDAHGDFGAIAQMGERLNGIQEVKGSIPFSSNKVPTNPYSIRVCAPPAPSETMFRRTILGHTAQVRERNRRRWAGLSHPVEAIRDSIPTARLPMLVNDFVLTGRAEGFSKCTVEQRASLGRRIVWFLEMRDYENCGVTELRQLFAYIHEPCEEGKWGLEYNGRPRVTRAASPATRFSYYAQIAAFFTWLVNEGEIDLSPCDLIKKPRYKPAPKETFSNAQISNLLKGATKTSYPRRDLALMMFLLDTAMRASAVWRLRSGRSIGTSGALSLSKRARR
jgi:hypothetical protein